MITEELPWENIIDPADRDLPTPGQIHHLKFSNDGRILMAMTQPYAWGEPTEEYRYDIFTWDVVNRRRVSHHRKRTKVCNPPLEKENA